MHLPESLVIRVLMILLSCAAAAHARTFPMALSGEVARNDLFRARSFIDGGDVGTTYDLPSARRGTMAHASDTLNIDSTYDCSTLTVDIGIVNGSPAGFRSIRLDSSDNAWMTPLTPDQIAGQTRVKVEVRPLDLRVRASGIVRIEDQTGKVWKVYYRWNGPALMMVPATVLDFGKVVVKLKSRRIISILNRLSTPVAIDTVMLAAGDRDFSIIETRPPLSHDPEHRTMLAPGDTLAVAVTIDAREQNRVYRDTLVARAGCTSITLPLRASTMSECITMSDLDFGVVAPGESKSLPLVICNDGRGTITFQDPIVTWLSSEFSLSAADIQTLATTTLGPGNCITITVTFKSDRQGAFQSVARFWASTRECRDSSIWRGVVSKPGPQISRTAFGKIWVSRSNPCTKNRQMDTTHDVLVTNTGDRPITVAKIELIGTDVDQGFFTMDSTSPATMIKVGDLIGAGENQHVQRVRLRAPEERKYSCIIRVITADAIPDTVENFIQATAAEAHVRVSDYDFGPYRFLSPGYPPLWGKVSIESYGNFDILITAIRLTNSADFSVGEIRRSDGVPLTLPGLLSPGDGLTAEVNFHPQSATPGVKTCEVLIVGSFSRCDDSVSVLSATGIPAGVAVAGSSRSGVLTMRIEPNPVTNEAAIAVVLPARAHTTAEIFDASGARVATLIDGMLDAGQQVLRWNTAGAPSGVYFCRVTSGALATSRSIVVTR